MLPTKKGLHGFAGIVALLVFWQLCSWSIDDPKLLPSLGYVVQTSFPSIAQFRGKASSPWVATQILIVETLVTIVRISVGTVLGIIGGFSCGIGIYLVGFSRGGNALALAAVKSIPLLALLPLFLVWFGGGEVGTYSYITFCVFIVIATSTFEAIRNVRRDYVQQALVLGARRGRVFRTVFIPSVGPELAGSLRNIAGLVWAFSLGAEYLGANSGLGYLVYQSYLYADMGKLLLFTCIYGILGSISIFLADPAIRLLGRWQDV